MRTTYRIAYSLGMDAADLQMQARGRTAWNEDDANLAARTLNQHFPPCMEHPDIRPELCGCGKCLPKEPQQRSLWPAE